MVFFNSLWHRIWQLAVGFNARILKGPLMIFYRGQLEITVQVLGRVPKEVALTTALVALLLVFLVKVLLGTVDVNISIANILIIDFSVTIVQRIHLFELLS